MTTPITTTTTSTAPAGAAITDVRVQNTGTAQTNVPFTFGQVFVAGQMAATDGLAAKLADGTVLPLQMDVKATHPDGSIRHAVISGVLPSLAASQTQSLQLVKSTASAKGTATPQALLNAGLTSNVSITQNGVTYTASLADAVAATATPINWLSGNVASEWIFSAPLKSATGAVHPLLTARFDVRWYTGLKNQARVEVVVENDKTFTTASNQTYDVNVNVAGRSVYSQTGLTHYHHARWHRLAWWDGTHAPDINVQLNTAYLISTKAVPNFDQTVVPSDSDMASYAQDFNASTNLPMTIGPAMAYMGTTGGRGDIGPLPTWSTFYLLSMDKRARDAMLAAADGSGSWSIHLRDEHTGYPVRTDNTANMNISLHPNMASTGPLPVPRCANNDNNNCATPYAEDIAHEPSLAYLPYVVTGDYYYLEELQFWAIFNPLGTAPGNAGYGQGLVRWQQVRGQAWSLRTLGHAAYITPDADQFKAYFAKQLDNNLNFYTQTYVVGNPNKLGVYDGSGEDAFTISASAPWQDDFLTWSFGYLAELGFSKATPILQWKAKYSVGRMTTPGYCWIQAAAYSLNFRDSDGAPLYDSFEKLYSANFTNSNITNDNGNLVAGPAGVNFLDLPCDSQAQADYFTKINGYTWIVGRMTGYADSVMGYPANLQPALAMAAGSGIPNAAKAWSIFNARIMKPDYTHGPQFDIIPR